MNLPTNSKIFRLFILNFQTFVLIIAQDFPNHNTQHIQTFSMCPSFLKLVASLRLGNSGWLILFFFVAQKFRQIEQPCNLFLYHQPWMKYE